mgnify:FL=1
MTLNEKYGEDVTKLHSKGLTLQNIANTLGISISTVRYLISLNKMYIHNRFWTKEEDDILLDYLKGTPTCNFSEIADKLGKTRIQVYSRTNRLRKKMGIKTFYKKKKQ